MENFNNVNFKRQLPSPEELKKEIPLSEEGKKIKEKDRKRVV